MIISIKNQNIHAFEDLFNSNCIITLVKSDYVGGTNWTSDH